MLCIVQSCLVLSSLALLYEAAWLEYTGVVQFMLICFRMTGTGPHQGQLSS